MRVQAAVLGRPTGRSHAAFRRPGAGGDGMTEAIYDVLVVEDDFMVAKIHSRFLGPRCPGSAWWVSRITARDALDRRGSRCDLT